MSVPILFPRERVRQDENLPQTGKAAISPDPKKTGNFGKVDFETAKNPAFSVAYVYKLKVIIG